MLSVDEQISQQRLVCPHTKKPLEINGGKVFVVGEQISYAIVNGVPEFLSDTERMAYSSFDYKQSKIDVKIPKDFVIPKDGRTIDSVIAFEESIGKQAVDALCISVGGGPMRVHPNLVNVNIEPSANVDVCADAYLLPYADCSVDAVYCEAVLEHLERPCDAIEEMKRVLKPEGELFSVTPFMFPFHGYPNHFQNLTLAGHLGVLKRSGFEIISSGVCMGPTDALKTSWDFYLDRYFDAGLIKKALYRIGAIAFHLLKRRDEYVNSCPDAHVLASTTFVRARKKKGEGFK
jgi:SAM-dependent methyltransferase